MDVVIYTTETDTDLHSAMAEIVRAALQEENFFVASVEVRTRS